jgi:predicted porin
MKMRKFILATSALVALAAPAMAVEAEFYGQVNKALVWADDGANDSVRVSDNSRSSTRFGFRGEQALGQGLTASFLIEGELDDADETRAMDIGPADAASAAPAAFTERHTRVGLSGGFGTVLLGRTSSATDGITEVDLGSVSDLMGSDLNAIGGNIDEANLGGDFDNIYTNMEGFSLTGDSSDRVNLVRYDSPIFNGFQASAAMANGGDFDLALRYSNKFGSTDVSAGLGYVNLNNTTSAAISHWSGSVSAKHDSGLNGTFAYGEREIDGLSIDNKFWYAKVGYDMGKWGFAADYGHGEEFATANEEADAYGVGAQYDFGNGVSASVLYRNFSTDIGAPTEDVRLLATGLRVKF